MEKNQVLQRHIACYAMAEPRFEYRSTGLWKAKAHLFLPEQTLASLYTLN